jgi:cytoskeletal protein RodZ
MNRKLLAVLVLVGVIGWFVSTNSSKEEQPPQEQQQSSEQTSNETESPAQTASAAVYKYVTQRGDSYTEMARKSVQAYLVKHNVQISPAAIIFAETNLTKQAGSPRLEVGQQVEFAEETLKQWVGSAQKLTTEQQAKWNRYVSAVNFDTSHVGEAQ